MKHEASINNAPRFDSPFHGWGRLEPSDIDTVGNYRLVERIGSGNFGVVFAAEHVHLGDAKAIKVFERIGNDPETLRAFVRSARYLAALDHPSIVKLYDCGATEDIAYLVMDLVVPGVSIDLVYRRIPTIAAIEMMTQVAGALEYAHAAEYVDENGQTHRGIFHGDIKPANILVGRDSAYLTDFMLPNMEEFQRRSHGHPCFPYYDTRWYGTPMYMAPEQLRGVVNQQTDVFSFGVASYELLTGKYPWDTEDDFNGRFFERETPVAAVPLLDYTDVVPEPLTAMIESCIALHAGDRPRDFTEVRQTLEDFQRSSEFQRKETSVASGTKRYDIAISFAGSERHIAEQIYHRLRQHCSVFYDQAPTTKADLWGSDLSTYLHEVYSAQSKYCIALISREYIERVWTDWERRAILQRMISSKGEQYVLPVQIDDVQVPGLPTTIGMLRMNEEGIDGIVSTVLKKLHSPDDGI